MQISYLAHAQGWVTDCIHGRGERLRCDGFVRRHRQRHHNDILALCGTKYIARCSRVYTSPQFATCNECRARTSSPRSHNRDEKK